MRIRRTKLLRIIGKKMITLPWGIYAAPKARVSEEDMTHEFIHIEQWKELWYVWFALWYVIEWLIRLPKGNAYKNISFEREAYANQDDLSYLKNRKRFDFAKYIKK